MNENRLRLDWQFGLKWWLASALGTLALGMVAYLTMWWLGEAVGQASSELLGVWVAGVIFGASLALGGTLGPGLLLRGLGVSPARWIGYSVLVAAVAMSSGVTVIAGLELRVQALASTVFVGLALGLPTGLVQQQLLRGRGIPATGWPLVTTAAYLLAFGIVVYFGGEGREWFVLSAMGLLSGAITGLGIMTLLRPRPALAG